MILLNVHPDISRGRDDVLALMFVMNDLWEQYAALQIRRHLRDRFTVAGRRAMCSGTCPRAWFSAISHGSLYVFENYAILSTLLIQTNT